MAKRDSSPHGIIYCVAHKQSGKAYIGQTRQALSARWRHHRIGKRGCPLLRRAIDKYGPGAFNVFVIAEADSDDELNTLEAFYITLFGSNKRDLGYNLAGGGGIYGAHSPETRVKLSRNATAMWANTTQRENMRQASIAARADEEFKARVAQTTQAQWQDAEAREKLLAAQAAGKAAFWADPVKRAARIAKRAATIERKRAEQAAQT